MDKNSRIQNEGVSSKELREREKCEKVKTKRRKDKEINKSNSVVIRMYKEFVILQPVLSKVEASFQNLSLRSGK